jgi:hypothetical protein
MPATTTEGTGPGSVYNVKPPIINGVVKNSNLSLVRGSGETVNTVFHTFENGVVTINGNTYVDLASVTYEPVLESSYVLIEYHCQYAVSGAQGDDFKSHITVNDMEITWRDQTWINGQGGGTRSGVIFPISMVYENSEEETSLVIKVSSKRNGSDDTLSVNTNSAYLRITEVAM